MMVWSIKVLSVVCFVIDSLECSILEYVLCMVFSFIFFIKKDMFVYCLYFLEEILFYILDGLLLCYLNECGFILIDLVLFG